MIAPHWPLIDSRASRIGIPRTVSMATLAPTRGSDVRARSLSRHDGTLYRYDCCIGQLAVYEREINRGAQLDFAHFGAL
jgi:hypothetical protein